MNHFEKFSTVNQVFLKFDFAVIVVYGSILTILGYSGNDAIKFLLDSKEFLFLISFLLILALINQHFLLHFTTTKLTKQSDSKNTSLLRYISYFQLLCHIFVIAFILSMFLDVLEKADIQEKAVNLDKRLKKTVQDFYLSTNRLPDSLKEIIAQEPHLLSGYSELSEYLDYTRISDKEFEISFIGPHLSTTYIHYFTKSNVLKPYWIDEFKKQIYMFYYRNHRIPFSLEELRKTLKGKSDFLEILPLDHIIYSPIDSTHYSFVYAGEDSELKTRDDFIENVELVVEKSKSIAN